MNITDEIISLEGGEAYLTDRETDAFKIRSGAVLIYAVPLRNGKAGRRSYIYTAVKGEVIPAFSYTDIEYCEWRFCLAPLGKARIQCIPNGSTKKLRTAFSEKADIKNTEREGFSGGIVDRYRLNTVTEDSFIRRTHNKRDEAAENIEILIKEALGGHKASVKSCMKKTLSSERKADSKNKEKDKFSLKALCSLIFRYVKASDVLKLASSLILTALCCGSLPFLVSCFFGDDAVKKYVPCAVITAVALFVALISAAVNRRVVSHAAQRIAAQLDKTVFSGVFSLSEDFLRRFDSSELADRILKTGTSVQNIITALSEIISLVFISAVCFVCASVISFKTALAGIVLTLFFAALYGLCTYFAMACGKKRLYYHSRGASLIHQLLGGVEKIRIAGVEDRALYEYLDNFTDELDALEKKDRFISGRFVLRTVFSLSFILILIFAVYKWDHSISACAVYGVIAAFSVIGFYIPECVENIGILTNEAVAFRKSLQIFNAISEGDESKECTDNIEGDIRLSNVTFSYSDGERNVIDSLSLNIKAGEYVGIAGTSGSGKSTLIKLLTGFERPTSGNIYYDNKDIDSLDKKDLRRKMGVVLQDGRLISGSIYENITVTSPSSTMADVKRVAELVGLRSDIASMPMGYHTVLSEDSDTLSGGQKQRILIARALINSPTVLLFDEATSALDNASQKKICEALNDLSATKIVIAHRLSTLKACDRIIVLDKGRVAEEGTYDFLMENGTVFPLLAGRQLI